MKRTISIFLLAVIAVSALAQKPEYYYTKDELPDLVKCLPAPPDTDSWDFLRDISRYEWGKEMRNDPERAAQAKRDAIWDLDTLAAIFSVPFGYTISKEETPRIYKAFTSGVGTVEQIRYNIKAYYQRIRPFMYFHEPSLFPQDDEELSKEGSYPSGHTIRSWAAALVLAEINPDAAEELFKRARIYGENRVIVGAHWQSDVDVSRDAASIGYSYLQTSKKYRKEICRAKCEFRKISR